MEETGFIKNPTIIMRPSAKDHESWLELGSKSERGYEVVFVDAYEQNFGWLYKRGWIDETELEKAKKNEKFQMQILMSGHMYP